MLYLSILSVGLPAIDQSLDGLIEYLQSATPTSLGSLNALAASVGSIFAVCVMAYECWMMMLGRRVLDIMKLLRIIGLSMCIASSGWICSALSTPGEYLAQQTKSMAKEKNAQVAKQEQVVAKLQNKYYEKVRALQDSIENAKRIEELGEDAWWHEKLEYAISNLGNTISNFTKKAAIITETKITEWVNLVIRFIGEAIFQIAYYALLIMQTVFLKLLGMFAPIMFAMSIAPPWSNAWSQWVSKYLSISLWGFVVYLCVYYADAILLYTLQKDITAYTALIGASNIGSWESIGTLGMQGIGSTCMYFVGMCIGAVLIKSVPEVCSWLIPGAISSSSAGGAGMGMITTAATAGGVAATVSSITVNAARDTAGGIGTALTTYPAPNQGNSGGVASAPLSPSQNQSSSSSPLNGRRSF